MSGFTPEGYKEFPGLIPDNARVGEFSEWETEVLEARVKQYGYFLQNDPMPRAKETATRIVAHLMFEIFWRRGGYDDYNEDELCDGSSI
jgi:hypothetical protein